MSEKLGPEKRLKRRKDFEKIFENGKTIKNRWFVMKYLENEKGVDRIGIVVSKKFGKAHVRNRFKRYVRETFRKMKGGRGVDVVVMPRKELKEEFENMDYQTFSKSFLELMKSVNKEEEVGS